MTASNGLLRRIGNVLLRMRANIIAFDVYTFVVMTIYSTMSVIYYNQAPRAGNVILVDAVIAMVVFGLVLGQTLTGHPVFVALRRFYIIPVIYLMYTQVHALVHVVHPVDYDHWFMAADRFLFGTDPTRWITEHLTHPVLTEYLQICYFLFYLMPVAHSLELWRRGDYKDLDVFTRGMAFCYFISYVAYFALPAVGPRFTLHEYGYLGTDLPGLVLTPLVRGIVDAGGGILPNVVDPVAVVNRDCMPSGHTWLTIVNIWLAFRLRSRLRWVFVVIGGSLVFSTVYLRYHYVVDVLVGAVMAVLTLPLEPYVARWIGRWSRS